MPGLLCNSVLENLKGEASSDLNRLVYDAVCMQEVEVTV